MQLNQASGTTQQIATRLFCFPHVGRDQQLFYLHTEVAHALKSTDISSLFVHKTS